MEHTVRQPDGRWLQVRHYLEMVAAMVVGMVTLFPLWSVAGREDASWTATPEAEALAMATAMALPMAGWMVVRGHGAAAAVEMSLAMYAGFVVLFPLLWSGVLDRAALLGLGHVAMLLLMALVMVRRPLHHGERT